jgi:S1-C subfamily serine protease
MNYSENDNTTENTIHNDQTAPYQPVSQGERSVYGQNVPQPRHQASPAVNDEPVYREYAQPDAYHAESPAVEDDRTQSGSYRAVPSSTSSPTSESVYSSYTSGTNASPYSVRISGVNSSNDPGVVDATPGTYHSGSTLHDNGPYYNAAGGVPPQTPLPVRRPPNKQGPRALAIALLAVVLLAVFGTGLFAGWEFNHSSQLTSMSGIQQVSVPPLKSTDLQARREEVIARIRPAVVQLNITTGQGASLGSGVIIDKNGYIVTNNHVVAGVSSVNEVVLSDGTRIKDAPVVGVDQQDDLAVIKINPPSNLTIAPLGDSSQLKVGQDVLAIGSPLGNTQTVTSGIISALGRNVNEGQSGNGATLPGTIQTDAPINPGNSGGALVDLNGNLIGIPTLTAVDPEFNAPANGVGFAIPSNRVKFVAEQLISSGKVTHTGRAAIGISPVSVDPNLKAQDNLPVDHGVLIYQLVSGGAAEKAGMKAGDVIVQIDGKAINSVSDLEDALLTKNPGDQITVTFYRNNQQMTLKVTLGELQANNR